jgi:four helix bundle protein
VPANIAEGYGRESTGSHIQFLRTAQGSLKELETPLLLAAEVKVAENPSVEALLARCESVGKLLRLLIRSLQEKQKDDRDWQG